jgi:hypothetical protein
MEDKNKFRQDDKERTVLLILGLWIALGLLAGLLEGIGI